MTILLIIFALFPASILVFCCKNQSKTRKIPKNEYVPTRTPSTGHKVSTERVEVEKKEQVVKQDKLPESSDPAESPNVSAPPPPAAPPPPPPSEPSPTQPVPSRVIPAIKKEENAVVAHPPPKHAPKWPKTMRRKMSERRKKTLELDMTQNTTQETLAGTQTIEMSTTNTVEKRRRAKIQDALKNEKYFDEQNDDDTLDCVQSIT